MDTGLSCNSQRVLYAEDIWPHRPVSAPEDSCTLQSDWECLEKWSENHYLQLNPAKCKYMMLSQRREESTATSPVYLCGSVLDRVQSFKYLGILITTTFIGVITLIESVAKQEKLWSSFIDSFTKTPHWTLFGSYNFPLFDITWSMLLSFEIHKPVATSGNSRLCKDLL